MVMSFFSTTEILKSLISGDLINEIVSSNKFKSVLDEVEVDKYVSPELVQQVINNLFKNVEVKKQLRQMIIEVLSDMGIRDEVDGVANHKGPSFFLADDELEPLINNDD